MFKALKGQQISFFFSAMHEDYHNFREMFLLMIVIYSSLKAKKSMMSKSVIDCYEALCADVRSQKHSRKFSLRALSMQAYFHYLYLVTLQYNDQVNSDTDQVVMNLKAQVTLIYTLHVNIIYSSVTCSKKRKKNFKDTRK